MVDQPLISVLMNCHNSDEFLEESINSVYNQSYSNWEIIFYDNNSTDKSKKIAKSYDSKLKYFYTQKKISLGKARHFASLEATGKYLAFLDCDDIWYDNMLEEQLKILKKSSDNTAFVYSRTNLLDERSQIIKVINDYEMPEGYIFDNLVKENFICFISVLVKKDKFFECGGFPLNYNHSTDYYIFLNMSYRYNVKFLDNVCCGYRKHKNNLSKLKYLDAAEESIEVVSQYLNEKSAQIGINYHYVNLSIAYFKQRKILNGFKIILEKKILFLFVRKFFLKLYL